MTLLALAWLAFASVLTRLATREGRLTLCRTILSVVDMAPEYTMMHHLYPNELTCFTGWMSRFDQVCRGRGDRATSFYR